MEGEPAWALDIGCGHGQNRKLRESFGYHYLATDLQHPAADVLVDAHRLPLDDDSVEVVLAIAVVEHLHNPFLAAREICRVLRRGGVFLGSVAFQEPYHSRSYLHHSHLGISRVLHDAGFERVLVGPSEGWNVLRAHAKNALFPGVPTLMKRAATLPIEGMHRLSWLLRTKIRPGLDPASRLACAAGAFRFVTWASGD